MKRYYVYILTNASRSSLYTGVTSTLGQRSFQHKHRVFVGFTSKYNVDRLVYFEMFLRITDAIAREKEIKGWTRKKKLALIESMNPKTSAASGERSTNPKAKPRSFTRHPALEQTLRAHGSLRMTAFKYARHHRLTSQ